MRRTCILAGFAAVGLWAAAAAQEGEDASQDAAPAAPLWLVSCSNQADPDTLTCEFSQSIVLSQGSRRVATASFVKDAGAPEMRAVFTTPVGVHLPAGLTMRVGDAEIGGATYQSCDAQGCYATTAIDAEALDALEAGDTLTAEVARGDRQPLSFAFQLEGFAESRAMLP